MNIDPSLIRRATYDPGAVVGNRLDPAWGVGNPGYAEEPEQIWEWICRAVCATVNPVLQKLAAERDDLAINLRMSNEESERLYREGQQRTDERDRARAVLDRIDLLPQTNDVWLHRDQVLELFGDELTDINRRVAAAQALIEAAGNAVRSIRCLRGQLSDEARALIAAWDARAALDAPAAEIDLRATDDGGGT